ncbi:hypothetical protein [Sphingomonas faeni]|uniref:hypothetical protein n=1 Tax=Sphingomonas faeni TaxID=185950 RepID=UPI00336516C2
MNGFDHRLPGVTKHSNLVLKRGKQQARGMYALRARRFCRVAAGTEEPVRRERWRHMVRPRHIARLC